MKHCRSVKSKGKKEEAMHSRVTRPTIGIGMVGHGFMGSVHTHAWRSVDRLFDAPLRPELVAVCGLRWPEAQEAAVRLGYGAAEPDYLRLLERDDVGIVDVCTPNHSHAEIAIAALAAGKHVLCEKPLAATVTEAEEMVEAAARARSHGQYAMVGFTYRRVPAIALAKQIVREGRLGTIRHVRARYLQDWLVDPCFPLAWRLKREYAGTGALGDLGAHIIDLAQFVTGKRIEGVSALLETFIKERPLPADSDSPSPAGDAIGPVTVDDAALFHARFEGGAIGAFESTRFALGRENHISLEINGSAGSIVYDFESMNELQLWDAAGAKMVSGFRRVAVQEPINAYVQKWWPPGHDYAFTSQAFDFLTTITEGRDPAPTFADALQVQRVMAAVESSSAANGAFVDVVATDAQQHA
jgi:predicted dehydrogenase